ncbi:6-pyruvoyl trahydropterin synthase family protein [Arenicella xantha]|uniref:6-carboxy-5,6,7,8-tetrahydropterin synthase n=1 Tax=Arenicella xantha TaxID=644221 RepID=A0A395JMU6_9GAMM|nr:6-carboxytetrahydropterin synthase [Arenicella xantha]RBP52869.1 6-pyruvoyltetrahydropterin/6-carboxytetrahydropterin synthase [Arenicella xantha]
MYQILKSISFCYGHRLLKYQGPCANLHGHNARAEITLASEQLDERGMVMDFGDIKSVIKTWIDDNLDHTMLLCKDDPLVAVLTDNQEKFYLMDKNPTAENIAELIFNYAEQQNFPVESVTLWESDTSFARFLR